MAGKTFIAAVDDAVRLYDRRLTAVFRNASQAVIFDAQLPVAKGGRMRVDTGFLRNSGRANVGGPPTGPVRGVDGQSYEWEASGEADVIALIARTSPGEPIFFGWTAEYARVRETYDGFLQGAVEKWEDLVASEAIRARELIR